jgi:hypothetical protein
VRSTRLFVRILLRLHRQLFLAVAALPKRSADPDQGACPTTGRQTARRGPQF